MRRLLHLSLSLFSLLTFLTAGAGDVLARHRCPHHDALPGEQATGSGHDHAAGHASDPAGENEEGHGVCTCLGQCQAESGQSIPVAVADGFAPILQHVRGRLVMPASHAGQQHPYLLPQANAPPFSA